MAKRQQAKEPKKTVKSTCVIPPPVSNAALKKTVFKQPDNEVRHITEYVESQARGEKVTHLEKLKTEIVLGNRHDAWDVRTNKDRYWVITNPTNLYSQKLSPSLDYTLSLHIGVTERVISKQSRESPKERLSRFESAWRRWSQTIQALDNANEAEDFQAVGMRCRECLTSFIKPLARKEIVPEGQIAPKNGDFIHWSELIANRIAPGENAEEICGYLKSLSKSTWQLVNWLTHSSSAALFDGLLAISAIETLITTFETVLVRYERGAPKKCPNCSSYQIIADFRPDLNIETSYVMLCKSCGWCDHNSGKPEENLNS